ncbi:unnamed protein product [Rotaria sp. Silwood2]|nr:unnamed protein product [Rotaria sp. Silwood2]CAF2559571.1 unnamed protein product [Rotaria sp. Silwood2]CAF2829366.1 unnamed protein product [Rotaria sp. Silwood2]CAF2982076.1 unnamed protein product [Rotaria sp. Silwood2]CAF3970287.1 unnamed protein product [Rotaria sp. Silwood2]
MSFQWTFLATFLYCEIIVVIILLLPFISPTIWNKFFKSRLAKAFRAGAKYYFNFIICIFGLLFLDAIRELRKYSIVDANNLTTPHAETQAHMKQFHSQRNFYIAGFALFLWFVIKRLINLLVECAGETAAATEAHKQAEGATRHLEGVMANDPTKIDPREIIASPGNPPRYVDSIEHDFEIKKYKQEIIKTKEDIDTLREDYDNSLKKYKKLEEEHRKLQIQLAMLADDESSKDK